MKRLLVLLILSTSALAQTVTHRVGTGSSNNVTSYASGSFTPAASELLGAFVMASGTVATGTMTDSQGLGFTKVTSALKNASADTVYLFIANNLAANSSMTVTFDCTGDAATGAIIEVFGVSSMTKTGLTAIRASKVQNNLGTGGTPNVGTFPQAALTTNPTVGAVGAAGTSPIVTEPTGWTELDDSTAFTTPAGTMEYVGRNSGFTGTSIQWGSTVATGSGAIIAELDASATATVTPRLTLMGVGE